MSRVLRVAGLFMGVLIVVAVVVLCFYYFGVWPAPSLEVDDPAIKAWLEKDTVVIHRRGIESDLVDTRMYIQRVNRSMVPVAGLPVFQCPLGRRRACGWPGLWQWTVPPVRSSFWKAQRAIKCRCFSFCQCTQPRPPDWDRLGKGREKSRPFVRLRAKFRKSMKVG